jgi:uncharacterized membrane protein (UPF0127 family)
VIVRVWNRRNGRVLGERIERAASFGARARGLLGRSALAPGEGLWIEPCSSIHMFFMRFSIDALFVSRDGRVRRAVASLAPWRVAFGGLRTRAVLELPAGTIAATDTRPGDLLETSATLG